MKENIENEQKNVMKKVLKLIQPYLWMLSLSILLAVVVVVFTLYAPILIGKGIDCIITKERVDFNRLIAIIKDLVIIVLITGIAQWCMSLLHNKITYFVIKDMRNKMFRHLEKLPLKYIDLESQGNILNRMISDMEQFSDGLLMGFTQLFTGMITIFGTIGFMLSIDFKITLVVVCITPLSFLVAGFIAKKTYIMFHKQSEIKGSMTSLVNEMVGNQKIVQAFGYEMKSMKKFETINMELQKCSLDAIFYSSISNPATRFINGLVYTGVGILGAVLSMKGIISIGQLSCFLSYANQYTKPFNEISGVVTEMQNALACAGRVFEFLEETEEAEDEKNAISLENATGEVSLEKVCFSYQKDVEWMKDLNLLVKPGQRVAIVGPTGCGKSTFINLLMRFYEVDSGNIRISGIDSFHIKRDSLRRNFGMVLQETWLKADTIKNNIAYGKDNVTEQEIMEAAKAAHAHSFIKRMPNGYDTVISEEGGNLSQGQKQLLCIARVMLHIPAMLILDEATSSIDSRTEIKVQEAFEKMMTGRTSFIVAHRLSTIKNSDIILVMKDGKIIEQGTHDTLLKQNGFYTNLYQSQFG